MLIDKTHKPWAAFTVAAALLSGVLYAWYCHASYLNGGNGPSGATWPGLLYGIAGFALMLFCGLLGVRKKVRIWRLGRAQTWLRAHIWLGLLAVPLIFFHSGLRFGNNLSFWIMVLFVVVTVSGILGVILQNMLPRTLLARVQAETTFEQIPHVIDVLRGEADGLISRVCGPLEGVAAPAEEGPGGGGLPLLKKEGAVQGKVVRSQSRSSGPLEGSDPLKSFYLAEVRPFLTPVVPGGAKLAVPRGAMAVFEHTRTLLPEALHETLRDLESICEERRQIVLQERLHFWLHCWLFIHAPLSYALLALSAVHAVKAVLSY